MPEIIIPTLNEEKFLNNNLQYYQDLCSKVPVIFVDGGSTDNTIGILKKLAAKVVNSPKGRGKQKDYGATCSNSGQLLFLHVDNFISDNTRQNLIEDNFKEVKAGCFQMKIKGKGMMYRIYEWAVNVRAKRFGILDGDLGLLIRKNVFDEMGGFGDYPIMEDILFGKKLKRKYKLKIIDQKINVSSRKWKENGFIKTFLEYAMAYVRLWSGNVSKKPCLKEIKI